MAKKNKTQQKNNNVKVGKPAIGNNIAVTNKRRAAANSKKRQQKSQAKLVNPAFNPNALLEGKNLKRAIQEQVKMAIAPTLRNIGLQGQELGKQEGTALQAEAARGNQLVSNIGNYYENLAAEEAQRIAAQQGASQVSVGQVQSAAQQAAEALQGANQGILAGSQTANPEGGASKEALAKALAENQTNIGSQGQALVANAAGSGQNWNGLLTAMAGSAGMRGGEQVARQGEETSSNLNRIGNEFGKRRTELSNAKLELLKERPELFKKLYNEAIERERNYGLSRATLGLEKEKVGNEVATAGNGIKYAEVNAQEQLKTKLAEIKAEERKRSQELASIGASEKEKRQAQENFRREEIQAQNEFQANKNAFREKELENPAVTGKGNNGKKSNYEGYQSLPKTVSYLRNLLNEEPVHLVNGIPSENKSAKQVRKAAYDKLVNFGASPQVAKAAIKKLIRQHKSSKQKQTLKKALRTGF